MRDPGKMNERNMINSPAAAPQPQKPMSVMDAIYNHCSVRNFTAQPVSATDIHMLLYAAVQAPTDNQAEPWVFAVIQDRKHLDHLSETAKRTLWLQAQGNDHDGAARRSANLIRDPEYHAFYNAGTLIIIYGRPLGPFVAADCWLAAENLMLAASAAGLGSCVIGLAVPALNSPEWKNLLEIPQELTAYAPILIGYPEDAATPHTRNPPEVIVWK